MLQGRPIVSVVMPAYNAEKTIEESIQSVKEQSFQFWELIVVDDGSDDNTGAVVENMRRHDSRIKYIRQCNMGPAGARNRAIEECIGEYIAFLDADDLWTKEKLQRQVEFFQMHPHIGLLYTDRWCFGQHIQDAKECTSSRFSEIENSYYRLLIFDYIPTLTVMVPSRVQRQVGTFDTDLFGPEDWDLWLRIAREYPIAGIDEPLAYYRVHEWGISKQNRQKVFNEIRKVMRKHLSLPDVPSWVRRKSEGVAVSREIFDCYGRKRFVCALWKMAYRAWLDPWNAEYYRSIWSAIRKSIRKDQD
jgi:teichuronic acid biosynthesis glycosyltransferase TuaG